MSDQVERTDDAFQNVKTWILIMLFRAYPVTQHVVARPEIREPYGTFPGEHPTLEAIAQHADFREAVRSLERARLIRVERGDAEWRLEMTGAGLRQLGEWSPAVRWDEFETLNRTLTTIVATLLQVTER